MASVAAVLVVTAAPGSVAVSRRSASARPGARGPALPGLSGEACGPGGPAAARGTRLRSRRREGGGDRLGGVDQRAHRDRPGSKVCGEFDEEHGEEEEVSTIGETQTASYQAIEARMVVAMAPWKPNLRNCR